MEWLYGIGTGMGWLVAFVTHVRFGRARAESLRYRGELKVALHAVQVEERAAAVKNEYIKKLEEDLDALDTPESVRARLRELLSPPGS